MSKKDWTLMLSLGAIFVAIVIFEISRTEPCIHKYSNTPISEVPARCINERGGLR